MIGAFARMLGRGNRVLTVEESGNALQVRTRGQTGDVTSETNDGPPERFVERIPHEGGDVVIAPILDALRAILRREKRTAEADASPSAPESSFPQNEAADA